MDGLRSAPCQKRLCALHCGLGIMLPGILGEEVGTDLGVVDCFCYYLTMIVQHPFETDVPVLPLMNWVLEFAFAFWKYSRLIAKTPGTNTVTGLQWKTCYAA